MLKFALTTLLLMFAFATPVKARVQNIAYHVDDTFCNGRALLGKAGAEARQRGVTKDQWRNQLYTIRDKSPQGSILKAVSPMGLLDIDTIYTGKKNRDQVQLYKDLYLSCMQFNGRTIAFDDDSSPYYAAK